MSFTATQPNAADGGTLGAKWPIVRSVKRSAGHLLVGSGVAGDPMSALDD